MLAASERQRHCPLEGNSGLLVWQVPVGLPAGGPLAEMAGAAHDGMRVPLALLPWLPGLLPVVTAALGEPGEEGDGNEARADGGG